MRKPINIADEKIGASFKAALDAIGLPLCPGSKENIFLAISVAVADHYLFHGQGTSTPSGFLGSFAIETSDKMAKDEIRLAKEGAVVGTIKGVGNV